MVRIAKPLVESHFKYWAQAGQLQTMAGHHRLTWYGSMSENIGGVGRKLHAPPSITGKMAAETGAGKLVLSRFMARSLYNLEANLNEIHSDIPEPW